MADEQIDFDETVKLISRDELSSDGARSCGLAEAVRVVVEDWAADTLRKRSAVIVRDGLPILHYSDICALYDRPDFPRSIAG